MARPNTKLRDSEKWPTAEVVPFQGTSKKENISGNAPKHAIFSDIKPTEEAIALIMEWGKKFDDGSAITELDTFNLQGFTNKELIEIIEKKLWVSLTKEEWVEKVNELLQKTKKFYKEILLRNIPKEIERVQFNTRQDITEFLEKTQGENSSRSVYCNMIKVALVVNDITNNPALIQLDRIGKRMIEKYLIKPLSVDNSFLETDDDTTGYGFITLNEGEKKWVSFSLGFRGKSEESSTIKSIHTPEVDKNTIVRDAIGLEFTLSKKDDIFLMMYFVYKHLFHGDIRNIRQKNLFSHDEIQHILKEYSWKVEPEFLEEIARVKNEVKSKWNPSYVDIKIIGDVEVPVSDDSHALEQSYSVEVKFVLVDNGNETGYSDHRIMDGMKKILANIRLEGFVSLKYIKRVVEDLFETHSSLWDYFVKEKVTEYYLKKLYRLMTRGGIKDQLYTSPSRWEALTQMENYPKAITGARKFDGTILTLKK